MKVWASFAKFEAEQARSMARMRTLMEQAQDHFRDNLPDCKEERKMLLETWLELELAAATPQKGGHAPLSDQSHFEAVKGKLPIKVKKRRPIAATSSGDQD